MRAFILIETEIGKVKEVVNALGKLPGVKSADRVTGPYDVISIIEGENLNELGDLITSKIKPVPYINGLVCCMSLNLPVPVVEGRVK